MANKAVKDVNAEKSLTVAEDIEMRSGKAHFLLTSRDEIEQNNIVSGVIGTAWVVVSGSGSRRIARVAGLGLHDHAEPMAVADALDFGWDAGATVAEVRTLSHTLGTTLGQDLQSLGFTVLRTHCHWFRDISEEKIELPLHTVVEISQRESEEFAKIIAVNYHLPKNTSLEKYIKLVGSPGEGCFLAYLNDEPAGTGRVFVSDDACVLGYGTTQKQYRKQGVQRSMINARLHWAKRQGALCAASSTYGQDRSSRNLVRCGFVKAGSIITYGIKRDH